MPDEGRQELSNWLVVAEGRTLGIMTASFSDSVIIDGRMGPAEIVVEEYFYFHSREQAEAVAAVLIEQTGWPWRAIERGDRETGLPSQSR